MGGVLMDVINIYNIAEELRVLYRLADFGRQ